jgi:hypothetical protein
MTAGVMIVMVVMAVVIRTVSVLSHLYEAVAKRIGRMTARMTGRDAILMFTCSRGMNPPLVLDQWRDPLLQGRRKRNLKR